MAGTEHTDIRTWLCAIIWLHRHGGTSDSLGRRACLGTSMLIFVIASGACGAAQTATQLYVSPPPLLKGFGTNDECQNGLSRLPRC